MRLNQLAVVIALGGLSAVSAIAQPIEQPKLTNLPITMPLFKHNSVEAFAEAAGNGPDGQVIVGMLVKLPPNLTSAGKPLGAYRINLNLSCDDSKWIGTHFRAYTDREGKGEPFDQTNDVAPSRLFWDDIELKGDRDTVLKASMRQSAEMICGPLTFARRSPTEFYEAYIQPLMESE